jgi:hypothetical protein
MLAAADTIWMGVLMPFVPLRARLRPVLAASVLAIAGCEALTGTPVPKDATIRPNALPKAEASLPPGKNPPLRRGNYVFYHDFDLDRNDPLFAELETLPDQVFGELDLPPTSAIVQVFLFDTQERYERYMKAHYPKLPPRRAYMIAEPHLGGQDDLKVFTWVGDHLRTDLRHELTHALLHSVLKDVPLWLDEGLAGFFELPPATDGINGQHVEQLARGPFKPDLARLERLTDVNDMQKPEYREAWAWVHLMLRSSPATRQVLRDYMQALRTTPKPGPILPKLREVIGEPDEALYSHLTQMPLARPRAQAP